MTKEEKRQVKDQKKWVKSLRFWKKINDRVRIIETKNKGFIVQERHTIGFGYKFSEWVDLHDFSTYKHALRRKHSYIVMILMRDLGCRSDFVRKRTDRKRKLGLI